MRAGDTVRHTPSGETWRLATNPEFGRVCWFGWPEGDAKESDCVLVEACSDEEYREMLEAWGARWHGENGRTDMRHLIARRQLCDLNQDFIGAGI